MVLVAAEYIICSDRIFMLGGRSFMYLLKIKGLELTHGDCCVLWFPRRTKKKSEHH